MPLRVRFLVAIPVIGVLAWMSAQVMGLATAGAAVHDVTRAMDLWRAGMAATPETVTRLREDLLRAEATEPSDPSVQELLGVFAARAGTPEYLGEARVHLLNALRMRPSSPYTWANLVAADYRLGLTGKDFETELIRAAVLGPYEPDVQRAVAFFGLAVWDEVGRDARAAVERSVAAGMKRNPLEMLQIAQRRGRLTVACRYMAGPARQNDPKWSQLCQSMEATS